MYVIFANDLANGFSIAGFIVMRGWSSEGLANCIAEFGNMIVHAVNDIDRVTTFLKLPC